MDETSSLKHQEEQNGGKRGTGGELGARPCTNGPPSTGRPAMWHGVAMLGGTTMPPGTAVPSVPAWVHAILQFCDFGLFILFLLHIWGPLLDLLEEIFTVELGFILA